MNKSIKYAGIATATLLAVAPAATPLFNGASVLTNTESTAKATYGEAHQEDAYNAFQGTFHDYNSATQADFLYGSTFALLNTNNRYTYSGLFLANGIVRPIHPQYQNWASDLDVTALLNEIIFVVVPANGESASEWKSEMLAAAEHGGSVSYRVVGLAMSSVKDHATWSNQELIKYLKPYELNGKALDKTVTAKTEVQQDEIHAMNVNFETPIDGYVGESKSDFSSNGKYPLVIKDNKGNVVNPQDVTSTFFDGLSLTTVINASQLPKVGKVTQKMTVKFNRNEYRGLFANLKQISVNGVSYQGGMLNKIFDKVNNSITLTRVINTTLNNYTDTKLDGVATVPVLNMGDKNITTTLYDGKEHAIMGRGLGQGTDWYTDTKRVNNATGAVYYRVSTNEWVKASDVSYRDKDKDTNTGDNNGDAALKDVTDLPAGSVVELGGIPGYVYSIFDINGTQSKVRHLASGTTWRTDKKATDANGDTYYRVSSNEWVHQGDGVTLK
ncbi:SLAP domain-containing protein [Companilactobacillus mishanensis]|uniref:SLAP domain-containing protein n=1 Tax=Companilactobacillus mishanensis TaxID=2486008 RepID=UPI00129750BF|nr:SLAP domain-containing protein [Companilactobacillus mishanensis]MQS89632.1 hypothetical protein [Companilactobacillus mishanensis]